MKMNLTAPLILAVKLTVDMRVEFQITKLLTSHFGGKELKNTLK